MLKNEPKTVAYVSYRVGLSGRRHIDCRYDYDGDDYDGQRESLGDGAFCRPYGGVACSPYIGNKVVYLSDRFRPRQVEESLRGRIVTVYSTLKRVAVISKYEMIGNTCDSKSAAMSALSRHRYTLVLLSVELIKFIALIATT